MQLVMYLYEEESIVASMCVCDKERASVACVRVQYVNTVRACECGVCTARTMKHMRDQAYTEPKEVQGSPEREYMMTLVRRFPATAMEFMTRVSTNTAAVVEYSASEVSILSTRRWAIISGITTKLDIAPT